uniref:Protein kinase domain-containing protein n=1 Tax=Leptobrachium leishanense TaxID=445787 RepID=A0A8C5WAV3_9ANUR
MQKFGYGTGVSVYLMKRSPKGMSHSPCAVKKVPKHCDQLDRDLYEQRLNEAEVPETPQHRGLYRAFTTFKDGRRCLEMEYSRTQHGKRATSSLSRSTPNAHYISTQSWNPKEALEDDGIITDKANLFTLGLTLWEMMTLSIPHVNLPSEGDDDESFDEDFEDAYYKALVTQLPLNIEERDYSYQKVIELSTCAPARIQRSALPITILKV